MAGDLSSVATATRVLTIDISAEQRGIVAGQATSDATGAYRIENLAADDYTFTAQAGGRAPATDSSPTAHLLADGLQAARVSTFEVRQQVRLEGYGSLRGVGAVVLERSGWMSVIGRNEELDPSLFVELRGSERLSAEPGEKKVTITRVGRPWMAAPSHQRPSPGPPHLPDDQLDGLVQGRAHR